MFHRTVGRPSYLVRKARPSNDMRIEARGPLGNCNRLGADGVAGLGLRQRLADDVQHPARHGLERPYAKCRCIPRSPQHDHLPGDLIGGNREGW